MESKTTVEGYELSPQQKGVWQLRQRGGAYEVRAKIGIEGKVDEEVLHRAVKTVVERHEILRTTYERRPGMKYPLQVIGEQAEIEWRVREAGASESDGAVSTQREEVREEVREEGGAVLRAELVKGGDGRQELEIRMDALNGDGQSLRNLFQDLARCYEAELKGESLADEPVRYVLFSEWQNEMVSSTEEDAEAGREHWRRQLSGDASLLSLPLEKTAEQRGEFKPDAVRLSIEKSELEELSKAAARHKVSESGWLSACWAGLLSRLSARSEIVLGEGVSGRKYEELEGGIGAYAKWLPVNARVNASTRFSDLLEQMEESRSAGQQWEEYFFRPESGEPSGAGHGFIFEYGEEVEPVTSAGLRFSLREQYACAEPFKLKLSVVRRQEELQFDIHYDAALFDATDIRRLGDQLAQLARSAVAAPETEINRLDILGTVERQLVIEEFNDTTEALDLSRCVHELMEMQAARTPEVTAVVYEDEQVSYLELNRRVNQLAHRLRKMGVGPEVRVGLLLERSVEMMVGLLAVLKAGGAYVPLDPGYPKQRLTYMLEESNAQVLLTEQKLLKDFAEHSGQVVCLDTERESLAHESEENVQGGAHLDNPAYVIFTSGSTGKPKGVAIGHRQLLNYMMSVRERLDLPADASYATVSTFSADLGNTMIFPSLCFGGSLHVISQERVSDPEAMADYFSRHRIDCLKIVPSHLAALFGASDPARVMPRKRLVLGGEASRWELIEKAERLAPECLVMNHYGPTETTVGVLTYRPEKGESAHSFGPVPLGRPIANTRVYVLDAHMQPSPIKVPGELYIGGDGTARGYINRPELTVERFVPDPFSTQPGARLYRTGDKARWLPEGVIEFLGRVDDQVKFHGFRVELSEIRSALNRHPQIRDSVVSVQKDNRGNDLLVAYYVSRQEIDVSVLRSFLLESVIEETIPNVYVYLKRLPLTLNGKVNYAALPGIEEARQQQLKRNYAAPRNATQEVLAGIWCEVLGIERVGIQDNFFELGGHSLLATQLISRVREAFQVELPLRSLFETPTIQGIADNVETALKADSGLLSPPIKPVERNGELPLSFAQQRLWFMHQLEPDSPAYNVIGAVRLKGELNVAALERCVNEIARRHEVLRTGFAVGESGPSQVITPELSVRLAVTDIGDVAVEEREAEARRLAYEEAQRPFDLSQSPLFRVSLLKLAEGEHVLLYTMHHIVSDAWSLSVMVKEVATLYEAFANGRTSPLPELPVQYADYAVWQREWLQGEVLESHLSYWKQRLGGNLPVLQLPSDRPRPATQSFRGATHTFMLSPELVKSVKEISRKESATPFMLLLASFETLLHKHTGQEDIVVGTDIANRNRSETEGLIGFFINQLALRTDMSGNPSFRELLRRVREMTLGAYAHQDLPFDKLVGALRPERNTSHTPLFQVLFVVQNAPSASLQLTNLNLTPFEYDNPTSKFDLGLFLTETEQGLVGTWRYSTDMFDASTIERLTRHWETLLGDILARPDERLSKLEMLSQEEREQLEQGKKKREESKLNRLKSGKRGAVKLEQVSLIKTSLLPSGASLPLVIEPNDRQVDIAEWIKGERQLFDSYLLKHGALLFRGFSVRSASAFERFASAVSPHLYTEYGDLPRQEVSGRVYASTPYPSDRPILFHNESSHMPSWPMRIMFCCLTAPVEGGETPIADCREVYRRLNPQVREELARRGVMYVRNFTDGLDVSWQEFFRTEDRAEAEQRCREMGLEWEWRGEGGLRTRKVRKAVARHPVTGEEVLFNQVQAHHVSFLEGGVRESLMRLFGEEGLPRNVYYGDGGVIEDEVMEEIREAYEGAAVDFKWEEGDVLVVDNMLTAHGRRAYKGERKIVVAMGEMVEEGEMERETMGAMM